MKQKTHIRILNALLSNCKESDRAIAQHAGVSQPTVTRARQKLQDTGIIKGYMAIPDYAKLGFKFGAVTLCERLPQLDFSQHSIVVNAPAISTEGDRILITLHTSMEDYRAFLKKVKASAVVLFATQDLEIKPAQASLLGA